ncbi:MAG TPA: hypothetical protein VF462_12295, partial [Micromonosporaceae bacterium]
KNPDKLQKNLPNNTPTSQDPKSPNQPGQTWHWHIKHPVEFSKNNHTPTTNTNTMPMVWGRSCPFGGIPRR